MLVRILSAAVGIPIFLGLTLWGPVPVAVAVVVLAVIALTELLRTYYSHGLRPNPILAAAGLLAAAWPLLRQVPFFTPTHAAEIGFIILIVAFVWEVFQAGRTGEMKAGSNVAWGLLCGVYVGMFAGIAALRDDTRPVAGGVFALQVGAARFLLAAFCVWATDGLAYFVGRALGKTKLAPKLSPGKTIAGAVGGFAGAVIIGAIAGHLLLGSVVFGLITGAVAGTLGQLGDLFKSALKREVGVKDFGAIMPGHGGVLDRFDSMLFVAPMTALISALA